MSVLHTHLLSLIQNQGPLSVAEFMTLALMHPEYGYYQQQPVFGARGDFITAPEISQLFGEIVGVWVALQWIALGRPAQVCLAELGPGRGTLMQDLLRATRHVKGLHAALELYCIEKSARLRELQQGVLREAPLPVFWAESVDVLPPLPLIIVSNEFFDAMPILQLIRRAGAWREIRLGLDESLQEFSWVTADPIPDAAFPAWLLERHVPIPDYFWALQPREGDVMEFSPEGLRCMQQIARHIHHHRGASLSVDYGYARTVRGPFGDSLQAVRAHRKGSVLEAVGLADLTAHVDFSALAAVAAQFPTICVTPLLTQTEWLATHGIYERASILGLQHQDTALMRLMAPEQMGGLFKVLALHAL